MTDSDRALLAFISTLIAIGFLSKVGGTGADLAIMTGLIGIGGMLAQSLKTSPKAPTPDGPQDVNVINKPDEAVPVDPKAAKP